MASLAWTAPSYGGTHGFCDSMANASKGIDQTMAFVGDVAGWMKKLEQELLQRTSFRRVARTLEQEWQLNENAIVSLEVQKNGSITNLKIRTSSGSEYLDQVILNFIQSGGNFPTPPNNIPSERGILIELCKFDINGQKEIKVWSKLNPDTYSRDFSLEHYLPADANHPWRKTSASK